MVLNLLPLFLFASALVFVDLCHLLFSMLKTLERYQKCSYNAMEPNVSAKEASLVMNNTPACDLYLSYGLSGFVSEVELIVIVVPIIISIGRH